MEIEKVNANISQYAYQQQATVHQPPAALPTPTQAPDNKDAAASVSAAASSSDQVQIRFSAAKKNLDTSKAIEQMHARLNEIAKGVRETNEGLAKASEKTEQMQSRLQAILKNFPPFSADSSQRQEILMSYVALRKEIERLMVPPPPAPIYEKVKKMWDSLFAQNGQIMPSAVPALDVSSSDKQVKEGASYLENSSSQLVTLSNNITQALIQP